MTEEHTDYVGTIADSHHNRVIEFAFCLQTVCCWGLSQWRIVHRISPTQRPPMKLHARYGMTPVIARVWLARHLFPAIHKRTFGGQARPVTVASSMQSAAGGIPAINSAREKAAADPRRMRPGRYRDWATKREELLNWRRSLDVGQCVIDECSIDTPSRPRRKAMRMRDGCCSASS